MSRVQAEVEGEPIWFESSDLSLRPAPEAFVGALLIPALARRAKIAIDAPLSPLWRLHLTMILKILNEWWDYPQLEPEAAQGSRTTQHATEPTSKTALCFSGGVDSFYSLLRGPYPIEQIVFVNGYDIPIGDAARMSAMQASLRAVSAACGVTPVVIRTNLRQHPLLTNVSRARSDGAAVAAIGHLLPEAVRRLVVSASYPYCFDRPCGSHWRLDELWSSERLHVVHYGASMWRADKLRAIAHEPLVRAHLRVCCKTRCPPGNCSACEKCLRTMLVLAQEGQLEHFPVFEHEGLIRRVDQLPVVSQDVACVYTTLLEKNLKPELAQAIRRLLIRSRRVNRWWSQGRNRLSRIMRHLFCPTTS